MNSISVIVALAQGTPVDLGTIASQLGVGAALMLVMTFLYFGVKAVQTDVGDLKANMSDVKMELRTIREALVAKGIMPPTGDPRHSEGK